MLATFPVTQFLNNKFKWYGYEVVNYYTYTTRERNDPNNMLRSV
jgi:hypothetical protein